MADRSDGARPRQATARRGSPPRAAAAHPDRLTLSDPPVSVRLNRSRAARRISLSVSRIDGRARVTAPLACPVAEIQAFLESHADWLSAAVARAPDSIPIEPGLLLPFKDGGLRLEHDVARRGVRFLDALEEPRLLIGGPAAGVGRRARAWLREAARAELSERSRVHADALGLRFSRIAVKDTRSRWGSCTSDGALSYSWRLILAPSAVLDYVAAHEVAHLREMNHSARFWALVERLSPEWRRHRDWLKRRGAGLHRYVVTAPEGSDRVAESA